MQIGIDLGATKIEYVLLDKDNIEIKRDRVKTPKDYEKTIISITEIVKKLENNVCKLFGKKYGLMVNSGSSANLLALASLNLKKGSEIITPNLTFSTTVSKLSRNLSQASTSTG